MVKKKRRKHKQHWYKFMGCYCPVCGGGEDEVTRVRVYGKKPKSIAKRYDIYESYDWCLEYGSL